MNLAKVAGNFIRSRGSDVSVYSDETLDGSPLLTERALKNSKKGTGQVVFQFLEPQNIEIGHIIVQTGARDRWEVTDVEDVLVQGTFSHFAAYVKKLGAKKPETNISSVQNITYNVSGPHARVNNHSVDNSTNMSVQANTDLESLFAQLRDEIRSQDVESSVINEALEVVDVIEVQSKQAKPNKTILGSMLNGLTSLLPHAGSIASIGSMILAATSS
ncbi:hypothetical protein H5154_19980 [Pseudoalteromonas sp. SR44-5]|uniref:hypothetical protein n=1 Tax=unclassified Pseudoalteromonas TaxID=194690 RepID=UPI0016047738|nr:MULTISPECIES: hypothetical protein [unclassified Pseudoalteromonas]MBB1335311.1 hypothetical protein [Pseudoalteromonas sp. SR41-6]MBB1368622.1 hypothetical protein [Pseudoalteromonas sp. SR44-5]MBB1460771.1 hypothetical protein [Pseudoalteromonas sp. SG41-8]MBB1470071.1 hypothetical protein [Pseudoalteromonas sp. SG41-5]